MPKADNLPPSCVAVMKYGNLNFLESSGPVQACNGTALPLPLPLPLPLGILLLLRVKKYLCQQAENTRGLYACSFQLFMFILVQTPQVCTVGNALIYALLLYCKYKISGRIVYIV